MSHRRVWIRHRLWRDGRLHLPHGTNCGSRRVRPCLNVWIPHESRGARWIRNPRHGPLMHDCRGAIAGVACTCRASARVADWGRTHSAVPAIAATCRLVPIAPQTAQSGKCRRTASASSTIELSVASARIADGWLVDMLVPINFPTARTAIRAPNAIGNASPKSAKTPDRAAVTTADGITTAADHLHRTASNVACQHNRTQQPTVPCSLHLRIAPDVYSFVKQYDTPIPSLEQSVLLLFSIGQYNRYNQQIFPTL